MRGFLKVFMAVVGFSLPAHANCQGQDLISALSPAMQAELSAKANAQPYAEGNLWRATRGEHDITIVGTYHLGDSRHERLITRLGPKVAEAKALLVEAGPEEEARLQAEIARRPELLVQTNGPTLPELLSEEDWQEVRKQLRARGIPVPLGAKMRPWYLAVMLGVPSCAMDPKLAGQGLDHQLIKQAQDAGTPIAALEPFDTLFSIFDGLGAEKELEIVRASLAMASTPEDMSTTLANAYFAGQSLMAWEFSILDALQAPDADPAAIEAQFEGMKLALMTKRNRAWMPVILKAADQGPIIVASGALHLPGETGVLNLLDQAGYQLTRLD